MNNIRTAGWAAMAGISVLALACSQDRSIAPTDVEPGFIENGLALHYVPPGQQTPFVPVASSAACVAGGLAQQLILPPGFTYQVVDIEDAKLPDLPDMNTVNETGPRKGRYLYRAHETGSNAAVSVTDLVTGETTLLAQRADWERFDGIVWTPWGTILAAEETSGGGGFLPDPAYPSALAGLVYEIDPATGAAVARPAVGARAHEGLRFDRQGNLYGISETTPGYIFKFVPDKKGDLSSGQLYALRITQDAGDRTGVGEWVVLDRNAVKINSVSEATAKGATGYGRPEDVEIGTSTGDDKRGNEMLYVAITSEDRVLAIDLDPPGGPKNKVTVSDYVRVGVNASAEFDSPDNLALDKQGNLYITEDPGSDAAHGKTMGDDVWFAPFNKASAAQSLDIQRFFTITDCDAEPTGIYLSISNKTLFVNVQHRGGADPRDLAVAIQRMADVNYNITVK